MVTVTVGAVEAESALDAVLSGVEDTDSSLFIVEDYCPVMFATRVRDSAGEVYLFVEAGNYQACLYGNDIVAFLTW